MRARPDRLDFTRHDHAIVESDNGLTQGDPADQPSQDPGWIPPSVVDAAGRPVRARS